MVEPAPIPSEHTLALHRLEYSYDRAADTLRDIARIYLNDYNDEVTRLFLPYIDRSIEEIDQEKITFIDSYHDRSAGRVRMSSTAREASYNLKRRFIDVIDRTKSTRLKNTEVRKILELMEDIDEIIFSARRLWNEAFSTDLAEKQANFLQHRLPQSVPAPVDVSIDSGRISLTTTKTINGTLSSEAIERIRQASFEVLTNALDVLGADHNADRRFAPTCRPLLRHLSMPVSELSVEALGMNWQIVSEFVSETKDTFPAAVLKQIETALKSTNLVLCQFDEWQNYVSAGAAITLSDKEIEEIFDEATEIASGISISSDAADPEISVRFMEIITPVSTGVMRAEPMMVPLLNSLSNYFAGIVRAIINEAPMITEAGASVAQSKPVQNALIIFALATLAKHHTQLSKHPMFSFIADGYEFAIKKFPWAKDTILK